MVKNLCLAALALGAPLVFAAPAMAQNAPANGVLLIYGNDKCPTDNNGDEIVVCKRADESERFRIPKDLRDAGEIAPRNQSFAQRMAPVVTDNPTGIGSCSTVGPGGMTGCFVKAVTQARQETKARKKEETDLPLP
jgi:hypothetical protein